MKQFTYQHLDVIRIEPDRAIALHYSEPDQGGTRLQHRFRILQNNEVEVESGYAHDGDFKKRRLLPGEIPRRVIEDALNWIDVQMQCSPSGNLVNILRGFRETISSL